VLELGGGIHKGKELLHYIKKKKLASLYSIIFKGTQGRAYIGLTWEV